MDGRTETNRISGTGENKNVFPKCKRHIIINIYIHFVKHLTGQLTQTLSVKQDPYIQIFQTFKKHAQYFI